MRDTGKGDVFIRVHALGVAVLPAGLVCHSVQDGAKLVVAEARILLGSRVVSRIEPSGILWGSYSPGKQRRMRSRKVGAPLLLRPIRSRMRP